MLGFEHVLSRRGARAPSVLERFTAEAAAAVSARPGQLAGVEAREAGRLLVIDLLPPAEHAHGVEGAGGAAGVGGAGGGAAAEELLRRLTASVVAAAAASEQRPGLHGVTEIARAGAGDGDAPSVLLGAADIAARRSANSTYGGLLGLAAGSAVLALLYATHAQRKQCLRRMRSLRQYAPSSSLFAEGDEGEDEDEGEGGDGDGDVPRRGGSVTVRLQLRREDVAADGRAAFELVLPLETLASVQALRAELCRRAAERMGRGVDGVSVAYIDNAGDTVAVDAVTSILDVKREAVTLIVTPTFYLS